jgi:hypothetical protein
VPINGKIVNRINIVNLSATWAFYGLVFQQGCNAELTKCMAAWNYASLFFIDVE